MYESEPSADALEKIRKLRDFWVEQIHNIVPYAHAMGTETEDSEARVLGMHMGNFAGYLESIMPYIRDHPLESELRTLYASARTISEAAEEGRLDAGGRLIDIFIETYNEIMEDDSEEQPQDQDPTA